MADIEQVRQNVQSRAPFSTWLGVVLLFGLFGAIAVALIGPAPRGDTYEQQRALTREKKLKELREEDAKTLTSYAWVDKNKGTVHIPIERAIELTVVELANKKPAPAGPIATPTPEASPAPSGPATASPHASGSPKPPPIAGPKSEARGQPTGAINPAPAQPGTQPNASATPAASPQSSVGVRAVSPSAAPVATAPGSLSPVRGATASPTQQ